MEDLIIERVEYTTQRINLINTMIESNTLSKRDIAIQEARLDSLLSERNFLRKILGIEI